MNPAGEFRLCSGCALWAIWTPLRWKGPVYCCEACARGAGCICGTAPDECTPAGEFRRGFRGGRHAVHQSIPAQAPQA